MRVLKGFPLSLKTNLSTHFRDYINKYINIVFKNYQKEKIKQDHNGDQRKKLLNTLYTEIRDLKYDFLQGQTKFNNPNYKKLSDPKYQQWIAENQTKCLPQTIVNNIIYDCKVRPHIYLYYAFAINQQIELLGKRPYQVIPHRTSIVPKHLTINTSALVD
jgi:hypothetical protein